MLIRRARDIPSSEITPESTYLRRRDFLSGLAGATLLSGLPGGAFAAAASGAAPIAASTAVVAPQLQYRTAAEGPASFRTDEKLTPFDDVSSYNNFYEFGPDKDDPSRHAGALTTLPWQIEIGGEVEKPGRRALDDILAGVALEERIYRLRCVEAWSMVVPWVGFPLANLLKRVGMTSRAKYVAFQTLHRPAEMPGQRSRSGLIDWPYVEGLRIDEAMHPLTLLAVGLYGRELPNQNGAPLRLVVPWKYGFKSIKSIVAIHLQERQPPTSWNRLAPHEYGFYANVNPAVDHPRWSQATERRLPGSLLRPGRIETLPFNGYGEQVASLYAGMDLRRFY